MILLLAGTGDAKTIGQALREAGEEVLATTVTQYGRELLEQDMPVRQGGLTAEDFRRLLSENDISLVVDATHPFAVEISRLAVEVCREAGVTYIRYERAETSLPRQQQGLTIVDSFAAAAQLAGKLPGNVFLTVGVNQLETFCRYLPLERLVVRVLPVAGSLAKCAALGIEPARIIALVGPFSVELNKTLFKEFQAGVIISKESGPAGGTDTKLAAARQLGVPVILVRRPQMAYPQLVHSLEELLDQV